MARRKPRRKQRGPYWKEPVVIGAVATSIALLVVAAGAMLHFSKPPSELARKAAVETRKEPPPTVQVDGREVNLDTLGAKAYADLLAEVSDHPETLEQIEYALVKSIRQGREKAAIPSLAPLENRAGTYRNRLRYRLKKLALLGAARGKLRPRAFMELGLFEYYRENGARAGETGDDITICPFGDAYAALGLTDNPQGGYSAAVFFFTRAIEGFDPNDQWGETNARRGTALADIALVLRAWGDQAGALELLSEAQLIFQFQHNAGKVAQMREYIDVFLAEGSLHESPMSAVALEIKEKLRPPQNMP